MASGIARRVKARLITFLNTQGWRVAEEEETAGGGEEENQFREVMTFKNREEMNENLNHYLLNPVTKKPDLPSVLGWADNDWIWVNYSFKSLICII